jgi:SAM-dependent methyltransferase
MDEPQIRFDDGAAYEDFMGTWSRLAGDVFLDWLAPAPGLRWVDVGCGNGAFTQSLLQRARAAHVEGIDPSEGQLAFARTRLAGSPAVLRLGDAMTLPYPAAAFDAAVMALVIFFVPDPAQGVAEMARVVKPGGSVSAYAWDMHAAGFPYAALQQEMAALGSPPLWPPSADASRLDRLAALWTEAGLVEVETREIAVSRSFPNFETFWNIALTGPRMAPKVQAMAPADVALLESRLRERLKPNDDGSITYGASANAIKGRVPPGA